MHCSPFLDQASHLIMEGIKLGIFPLHKSMLTPPNLPVTPHLFGSIFQVYLPITFSGIKMRLTSLWFSVPSILTFLAVGVAFFICISSSLQEHS